jgi:hypothetical protein
MTILSVLARARLVLGCGSAVLSSSDQGAQASEDHPGRLVESDHYTDHIIAALTLEPAGHSVRWSLVALDHQGDGVLYVYSAASP